MCVRGREDGEFVLLPPRALFEISLSLPFFIAPGFILYYVCKRGLCVFSLKNLCDNDWFYTELCPQTGFVFFTLETSFHVFEKEEGC